jgi:hypothetical protein
MTTTADYKPAQPKTTLTASLKQAAAEWKRLRTEDPQAYGIFKFGLCGVLLGVFVYMVTAASGQGWMGLVLVGLGYTFTVQAAGMHTATKLKAALARLDALEAGRARVSGQGRA